MDEGLGTGGWGMGAGGVEERKDFSPPSVPTAIAASPLVEFLSARWYSAPLRLRLEDERSQKRENGSCFWGQVCGECAAHESALPGFLYYCQYFFSEEHLLYE